VNDLTYPEIGATRHEPLPARYNHLHHRARIGFGADDFTRAGEAVMTFAMHRAAGAGIRTEAGRARPGVRLTVVLGPFRVPCEVVYTVEEPNRIGFGYGSLPGHVERGEESFVVERDTRGDVWFRVTAFSKPARWPTIIGGPVAVMFQRGYARYLGWTLKRLVSQSRSVGS
jgi:uncharacterized protein (UPF0548 family)